MTDDTTKDDTTKQERDRDRDEGRKRPSAGVKVTDKRMFGPDGELREEYSFLEQEGKEKPERGAGTAREPTPAPSSAPTPESPPESPRTAAAGGPGPGGGPSPGVGAAPGDAKAGAAAGGPAGEGPGPFGQPSFLDLVSVLAEPVAIYLGDVKLPDGRNAENLDMARFHIDLLDILRQKTEGQLTEQERAVLDDLLYRLRMRFVQKRDTERSGLENRSNIETPG